MPGRADDLLGRPFLDDAARLHDQDAVGDASAIGPMVATLLHGMAMALFKTLVGSVLNVWLMVDYRLLEAGATHVLTHVVEIGERDAAA